MSQDELTHGQDPGSCSADVAAYALGALEPAEAEAFRRHLQTCAVCPEELRAFQQVADDLAIAVPRVEAPPELKRRVMSAIEQEPDVAPDGSGERSTGAQKRRARRRDASLRASTWLRGPTWVLGAGMAFALAAVIVVIVAFPGRQNGRTVQADTTVGGTAALQISAHRTQLVVRHISAPPRGKIYEVWVQYGKHAPRPNALFGVDRSGDASVDVAGSMYGVSHVMVTAEPAPGGTRAPTGNPVITASLS
ncbi:MAG TPA: anti-sigma factor [Solirubrobacteraceae bacterium]|nr:anti-sigma factor [Solirubrobacteraceae bacterium]